MNCYYCRRNAINGDQFHDLACPVDQGHEKMDVWEYGFKHGRKGSDYVITINQGPAFTLGFLVGQIALEEAENGHQSWRY